MKDAGEDCLMTELAPEVDNAEMTDNNTAMPTLLSNKRGKKRKRKMKEPSLQRVRVCEVVELDEAGNSKHEVDEEVDKVELDTKGDDLRNLILGLLKVRNMLHNSVTRTAVILDNTKPLLPCCQVEEMSVADSDGKDDNFALETSAESSNSEPNNPILTDSETENVQHSSKSNYESKFEGEQFLTWRGRENVRPAQNSHTNLIFSRNICVHNFSNGPVENVV